MNEWKQFFSHMWPRKPNFTPPDYPDLNGKVFLVTGANSGIGFHVTRLLLQNNAKVWMVGRDGKKMEVADQALKMEMPSAHSRLDWFLADFADLNSIKPGVEKFLQTESRLDCVIHNAGVMIPENDEKTVQGFDWQIGVNCIAPWLLQRFLDEKLINTASGDEKNCTRIIWVSSSAHMYSPTLTNFNFNEQEETLAKQSKQNIYGISKAINIMQGIIWSDKHKNAAVVSLSCHPGNCNTGIQRNLKGIGKMFRDSTFYEAYYGAFTELYAALHPKFSIKAYHNGAYIIPFGQIGNARQDLVNDSIGDCGRQLRSWLDRVTDPYYL